MEPAVHGAAAGRPAVGQSYVRHLSIGTSLGKLSAREQIARWHELMDEHQIETAVCFPTGSGSVVRLQEVPFQIAVARACND
jgi:hypothetical protein